jgi:hypothetical protein
MKKEFVPYELALRMKQIGFNENKFAYYYLHKDKPLLETQGPYDFGTHSNSVSAPLFQQAFRWFREKHKLSSIISQFGYSIENQFGQIIHTIPDDENPLCYEEAELACLEKLIDIVEGIESQK